MNAAANGTTDDKPFLLRSGVARLNHADIDLILNSGGGDFQIPSTSTLIVDNGSKVRASGNGSSLFLDGALVVDNGGKFLWEGTGGNHIKYSASGNASIWLGKDAKFHVGSQLFRNSEGGILNFTQANASSDVHIATIDAPLATKGVFEVLNDGSSFTQSQDNSVLTVERGQSGSNPVPAIRYNPSTWSVAKGSKMIVGKAATSSSVGLYADQPMGGLDLVGATTLDVWVAPLTLNGTLNIGTGSAFNAADLDLTLKGDLLANGHFNPGINTTYFSGLVDQQLTGNIAFYNLSKLDGSNSLVIDDLANVNVSNELLVERGNVSTGSEDLMVQGNAHIALDASIDGLELNGASLQLLSGGGALGRLVINNNKNVMVPSQPDAITVNGELVLYQGIFDIGSNLLQLGKGAIITDRDGGSAFSETNMIQTFLSFTDAGVRKYFPAISSNTTFVYPIGSQNKYTPVTLNISEITSSNGYIRVKAANEPHVSILDDPETSLVESKNVLQYYWTVDAVGIEGFRSEVSMQAYADDVIPALEKDNYIVARIRANEDAWNKEDITNSGVAENIYFDGTNSMLVFNGYFFEGTDDLGISGDYTAGLASAIPDKVPTVISVNTGDWNNVSTWAVYDPVSGAVGAAGAGIPQNGPLGSIVYIRENVGVNQNGRIAYRTVIESGSTLDMGSTINNRLGNVSGEGRLRVENGSLPAGFYEAFAHADGGIFEYSGNGSYSILGGVNTLNSLELTGSGERKLHDGIIRLYGNLLIDGVDLSVNMQENTELQVGKDFTFNNGDLYLGAESQFVFNGTSTQTVGGIKTFTGSNALQIVRINNSAGVKISSKMEILNHLQLDKGEFGLESGATLHLGAQATTAGASFKSYVNAPLSKAISGYESFEFPLGEGGRYGAFTVKDNTTTGGNWIVKYHNASPLSRDKKENVAYISNNEYWAVTAPSSGAKAVTTLRWDDESGINPVDFDVVSFEPSISNPLWTVVPKEIVYPSEKKVVLKSLTHNTLRYYSFGLQTAPTISDYTWKGSKSTNWFDPLNWYGEKVPSAATPALIAALDIIKPDYWPVIAGFDKAIAQANNLTIEPGATLTLNPGGKLTVNGNLNIADVDGLLIKHQAGEGGMSSLLTHGDITGEANVQLILPKEQWFYLGSSIVDAKFGDFSPGISGSGTFVNVYRNKWYSTYEKNADLLIDKMEGLAVHYHKFDDQKFKELSYTGVLNNKDVDRVYTENRFQLMANPFPSFIDWSLKATGWQRGDFKPTIWYRMKLGEGMAFVTYNYSSVKGGKLSLNPTDENYNEDEYALIAPMQAVYIRPLKAGAKLSVGNSARSHGSVSSRLKSSGERQGDVVRIVADNGRSKDGAVIYFAEDSEDGLDLGDSEKYRNDDLLVPEIFTLVEGKEVAINGLPSLGSDSKSIELVVRNEKAGSVHLNFDLSYYRSDDIIILEDQYLDKEINIREVPQYRYEPFNLGTTHNRFVLHFNPEGYENNDVSTPVDENTKGNAEYLINIVGSNGRAIVSIDRELLQKEPGKIEVFNTAGGKISEFKAKTNKTFIVLPETSGVYLVVVKAGGKMKSQKLIR